MYRVIVERSIASGEGSQSFSPRPAAVASSITRLYHRRLALGLAGEVAIEGADELEDEAVGALEGVGIEGVRYVGGGMGSRREQAVRHEAADRRRRESRGDGGKRSRPE